MINIFKSFVFFIIMLHLVFPIHQSIGGDTYIWGDNINVCTADNFSQCIQGSAKPLTKSANSQDIYDRTDRIFYKRHPELRGQQIDAIDNSRERRSLVKEWFRIRRDVCNKVADNKFYRKHPELSGQKIDSIRNLYRRKSLSREWVVIRNNISGCN